MAQEHLVKDENLIAIANEIRALLDITNTMSLDQIVTHLKTEQTNISNAFTAIESQGGTIPSSQVSGNLASAITSIPTGGTSSNPIVQTKSGTFTLNSNGKVSVNCGFSPDIFIIFISGKTYDYSLCFALEQLESNYWVGGLYKETTYNIELYAQANAVRTSTGVNLSVEVYMSDWTSASVGNTTLNYTAIKYT